MEFNVVETSRIQESFGGFVISESFQLEDREDENWHADERYSTIDQNVSCCYDKSDSNQDIIVANTEMASNDIEIIAIDPNGECTDEESSVFEEDSAAEDQYEQTVTIESVKAALQQGDHHRIYRKSISLPHSPTHYSLNLSGMSLDDLDLQSHMADLNSGPLMQNEAIKSFDLASYITQDDNFEVISPAKVLPNKSSNVNNSVSSLPMLHKQMENIELSSLHSGNINNNENNNVISTRRCVISTKKMHYEVPSSGSSGNSSNSDSDDELSESNCSSDENEGIDAPNNDNPKVDPTWFPTKNTRAQKKLCTTKPIKKVKSKTEKKVKKAPIKASKSTFVSSKQTSTPQQKNLLKVCKKTSRTGILNAGSKLTKDKVHKITKSPAGKTVKLDHDYCTFKAKSESSFKAGPQRKAIEIPIMDPTFEKKICRLYKNFIGKQTIAKTETSSPDKTTDKKTLDPQTTVSKEQMSLLRANQNHGTEKHQKTVVVENIVEISSVQSQNKRKLNIADYMKRRQISNAGSPVKFANAESRPIVDPILAAKHKVLRMQELKKEAKLKEAEPKIENMPLLPILPLEQITGAVEQDSKPIKILIHPDYEEIIIVSMGSNTDITIPPSAKADNLLTYINDTIKKVQTQDCGVVLNSSSLIVSIQDVVLKKTSVGIQHDIEMVAAENDKHSSESLQVKDLKEKEDAIKEHGEDKVIMHLRKDRKKPISCSIAIQTIDIPSFSTLKRMSVDDEDALENENRIRKAKSNVRKSRSRSNRRDKNHSECSHRSTGNRSRSPHYKGSNRDRAERTLSMERYTRRSRTISGNSTTSTSSSSSSSSSGNERSYRKSARRNRERRCYNSASSRRSSSSYSSRSRSRESIRYKQLELHKNVLKNEDPEKRNIVYVGQLEESMTKENLRKKFLKYGIVRNISLHHKENGMRYGFVTFSKPEEAYCAIDGSNADENISMYDISFGGRRAFCKAQYADLDGINNYINYHDIGYTVEPYEPPLRYEKKSESFDDMLKKLKQSISARKPTREFNA